MRPFLAVVVLWTALAASPVALHPAAAGTFTVDFDAFPEGTTITAQYPGIAFVNNTNGGGGDGVQPVVTSASNAPSGTSVGSIREPGCGGEFCSNLAIGRFTDLRSTVSVKVGSTGSGGETAVVTVRAVQFDGTTLVPGPDSNATTTVTGGAPFTELTVSGANIAFVIIKGPAGRHVAIDELSFDVADTPGPTTSSSGPGPGPAPTGPSTTTSAPAGSPKLCALVRDGAPGPITVASGGSVDVPLLVRRTRAVTDPLTVRMLAGAGGLVPAFSPSTIAAPAGGGPTSDAPVVATITSGSPGAAGGTASLTIEAATADGSVRCTLVLEVDVRDSYSVQVNGIEVTQGTQTLALPSRGPDATAPVPYAGVQLAADGRTIVRVYASVAGGPTDGIPGVEALLTGYAAGSTDPLPGSPLHADWGTRTLLPGPASVTPAERTSPSGAYTFTLPPTWTRGTLSLRAEVHGPSGAFAGIDACATPECSALQSFTLTGIAFTPTGEVHLVPVELIVRPPGSPASTVPQPAYTCYRTRKHEGGLLLLSDPYNCDNAGVFAEARNVLPAGDGHLLTGSSYWGEVDISSVLAIRQEDLDRMFPGVFTESKVRGSWAAARLFEWADDLRLDFNTDEFDVQQSNFMVGVFPIDFNIGAVTKYSCTGTFLDCDEWPVAVVRAKRRPLTSVSHELFHMLGRAHASGCGGAADPVSWPPDEKGYLQGVGLDRRAGSGGSAGPYAIKAAATDFPGAPMLKPAWYDFMSYCAANPDDPDSWISPRYWNETMADLASGPPGAVPIAAHKLIPSANPTLTVDAIASGDTVLFTRIAPDTRQATENSPATAEYRIVSRDASGNVISDQPMGIHTDHLDTGEKMTFVRARVDATNVAAIDVTHNGVTVAHRAKPATPPTVTITSPHSGDRVGSEATTTFTWDMHASGPGPGDSTDIPGIPRTSTAVDLSVDGGSSWRPLTSGTDQNSATVRSESLQGTDNARIRVRVSDGFNETAVVSDGFTIAGHGPTVLLTSPGDGSRLVKGSSLYLSGEAYDDANAAIDGSHLSWKSDDRDLGNGSTSSATDLAPGIHVITLTATDARGRTGSGSTCIEIVDAGAVAADAAPVDCPKTKVVEAAAGGAPTGQAGSPSPAKAGTQSSWWLAILVIALVVVGAAVAIFARTRRRRAPPAT